MINLTVFSVERLRANAAHSASARVSHGLIQYMQSAFGLSYVAMASDLLILLRCLIVSATLEGPSRSRTKDSHQVEPESHRMTTSLSQSELPISVIIEERAKERLRYRIICGWMAVFLWVPLALGIVSGVNYPKAMNSVHDAQRERQLRYAAGATGLFFVTVIQVLIWYCVRTVRDVERTAVWILYCLATFLSIVSVYRIAVMHLQTDSLTSTAQESLNTTSSKVAFYILQIAPEWLVAATLLSMNMRERFKT
ncbi:hypothetical protein EIP91_011470, partial [Steccherinum ochraceum]